MKNRLPVSIENYKLPDEMSDKRDKSYGYVNILYIVSLIVTLMITFVSMIIILNLGE